MQWIYSSAVRWRGAEVVLSRVLFVVLTLTALAGQLAAQTPASASPRQTTNNLPAAQPLTLADLERMALEGNPTLAQAEAAIRAAEGRRVQAGLMPNPIIGYAGEELAFRAIGEKSEHLGFIFPGGSNTPQLAA